MKKFYYKALKENKKEEVCGFIDAETHREAREKVRQLGFMPTNIHEENPLENNKEQNYSGLVINSLTLSEKIFFTSELQVMLSSSISMIEALSVIVEHAHKPRIIKLASDLQNRIAHGATFSDAIKPYAKIFGDVFVGLCTTGEASGELDKTLERMVMLLKKQDDIKSKIISMSVYPVCLILIIIAIFFACGFFIFPKLIEAANISASDVPLSVNWIIFTCSFLLHNWIVALIVSAAGIFALIKMWERSVIKEFFDSLLMNIPVVSDFVRYINLSSFFAVLNVAYEAGVPISTAMDLSSSSIANNVIKNQAKSVEKMTSNGQLLSQAFSVTGFVPPTFNVMIATGEKSGRLGQMFRDIAIAIDKKLDAVTDALAKAFEPTLTVIIGIIVGYIAIAMLQLFGSMFQSLI